jgi:AcrR family transcriptional regulator
MSPAVKVDRAALVRRAFVELVAANGFRGTSMAAVASRAGVATGTAYVHYQSKDEVVLAAYREVKADLGQAAAQAADASLAPADLFGRMWRAMYDHLAADPVRARFLIQVAASPYAAEAHEAAAADDELINAPDMQRLVTKLLPLPPTVLWDLSMGPAIRLAAGEHGLTDYELEMVAKACWRAVSLPSA